MLAVETEAEPAIGLELRPLGEGLGYQLVFVQLDWPLAPPQQMPHCQGPRGHGVAGPDPGGAEDTRPKHAEQLQLDHGDTRPLFEAARPGDLGLAKVLPNVPQSRLKNQPRLESVGSGVTFHQEEIFIFHTTLTELHVGYI